jgi:hypothetical protein
MAFGVRSIDKFRENAIENGKDGLESAVLLLVRHFDQQFGDFSIPQKLIIAELESSGITSPDIFRGEMATLAVHEKLRAKVDGWTDVAGSNVFDSKGILINSSRIWPVPEINIADRAYFMKLATDPALEVAVEIVPSRLSNIRKRSSLPDGFRDRTGSSWAWSPARLARFSWRLFSLPPVSARMRP